MNTTSDLAALVSKKKVRIAGQGQDVSSFQGLIYARDSVEIRNTTVMGAIVSKDDAATTELENITAVNVPELANWDIEQHLTLGEAMESGYTMVLGQTGGTVGVLVDNDRFIALTPDNTRELKTVAAALAASNDLPNSNNLAGQRWSLKVRYADGTEKEVDEVSGGPGIDARATRRKWADYVIEHHQMDIIKVDIFEINLNRLNSLNRTIELIYHASMPL